MEPVVVILVAACSIVGHHRLIGNELAGRRARERWLENGTSLQGVRPLPIPRVLRIEDDQRRRLRRAMRTGGEPPFDSRPPPGAGCKPDGDSGGRHIAQ